MMVLWKAVIKTPLKGALVSDLELTAFPHVCFGKVPQLFSLYSAIGKEHGCQFQFGFAR